MLTNTDLDSWQKLGSQKSSINSHESIRYVLSNSDSLKDVDFEIFLQGSIKIIRIYVETAMLM